MKIEDYDFLCSILPKDTEWELSKDIRHTDDYVLVALKHKDDHRLIFKFSNSKALYKKYKVHSVTLAQNEIGASGFAAAHATSNVEKIMEFCARTNGPVLYFVKEKLFVKSQRAISKSSFRSNLSEQGSTNST